MPTHYQIFKNNGQMDIIDTIDIIKDPEKDNMID